MAKRCPRQHWLIRGYDSSKTIYEKQVEEGLFSEQQIQLLLMTLAASELNFDEILGACAKKKTKLHNGLLVVHRETTRYLFWCGNSRYFTAEIAEHKGKPWTPEWTQR